MAARNKPFEQFGPYILFKKLEQDALGDLWRAGRIEGGRLGATVALRRLSGGDRAALTASVEAAARIVPQLTGTSFARDQVAGVADGTPFLAWDYAGGRSLRHIIDRGRGGKDVQPNPLPIDQAIVIAEKVALSLATTSELRDGANGRLSHGALLPQFIWISDDGEIRVAGHQLGAGILGAVQHDPKIAAEIGRYLAPEFRTSGQAPKSADVFAMGAILFLLVTGHEPPDAMTASAFVSAVRAAKTLTGAPVPDDIRVVLDKSFNLDPSMRYASMGDMKQALSALAHGGKYSATTFNLAFYLSNLLKKEMEAETLERDKESKLNLAPYLEAPKPAAAPMPAVPATLPPAMFAAAAEPAPKSKLPLAVAAVVALAAIGGGAWWFLERKAATMPATTTAAAQLVAPVPAPVQKPAAIPEPIVAVSSTTAATATTDPDAQKKAFEDAVKAKLQEEMMKLQNDYLEQLKKQQSKNAPVAAAPAASAPVQPAAAEERPTLTAAQLDQQRRDAARAEEAAAPPVPAPVQTTSAAPPVAQPAVTQPAAPVPAPVPAVREGDVVEMAALDAMPRPTRPITAIYPPIARQQKIAATVVVTALINERGEVTDVKLLRGVSRFGIDDAAVRAMRSARFTPPMKDGKRVKTWFPQTIEFRP